MPSTFAWLDQSEEQRRKVLDIVDMFKEQGTVDELGLGTVRDAVADILFPGTSNLMDEGCLLPVRAVDVPAVGAAKDTVGRR